MEHHEISKLLDDSFVSDCDKKKKWIEVNDLSGGHHSENSENSSLKIQC